jgi:hypothetical protein
LAKNPKVLSRIPEKKRIDYASLIETAMQPPQDDALRVAQARDLLLSGELESAWSIRETARTIVEFGL